MSEVGDAIAAWCLAAQDNGWYYTQDMTMRNGPYATASGDNWGADCSSYVNIALVQVGIETPGYLPDHNAWSTSTMRSALAGIGWTEYAVSDVKTLDAGDVLWRSGHTTFVSRTVEKSGSSWGSVYCIGEHYDGSDHNGIEAHDTPDSYTSVLKPEKVTGTGLSANITMIAAICGNWWTESNINPVIWEQLSTTATWDTVVVLNSGTAGGYGLAQWTNTAESEAAYKAGNVSWRLRNYHDWVVEHSYSVADGNKQCYYLIEENSWSTARLNTYGYGGYGFTSVEQFISDQDFSDLDVAAAIFGYGAEGNVTGSLSTRQEHAKACYDYISQHKDDESITAWINYKNAWLSESEILNNAVMVYRAFNNYISGGSSSTAYPPTTSGNPGGESDDSPSTFENFLMAMLGKNGQQSTAPVHIKGDLL